MSSYFFVQQGGGVSSFLKALGKKGVKAGAKSSDEILEAGLKSGIKNTNVSSAAKLGSTFDEGFDDVIEAGLKSAGKGTDEAAAAAGDAIGQAGKSANKIEFKIINNAGQTAAEAGEEAASFASRHAGKLFVFGATTLTAGAVAIAAKVLFDQMNDTEFIITDMKVKPKSEVLPEFVTGEGGLIILTYKLAEEGGEDDDYFPFETFDRIELKENDSTPKIPLKMYDIIEVDNDNKTVTIHVKTKLPTDLGKSGRFLYKTSFNNALRRMAKETTEVVTDTAIGAASGVAGGIAEAGGKALGVSGSTFKWIVGGIIAFLLLTMIGGLIYKFTK